MNIHEYQAKKILGDFGLPVLKNGVAKTSDEALKIAEKLDSKVFAVKAQIHAGGRGKGGGVKLARSLDEVKKFSEQIIGMNLVTPQTGEEGQKVHQVLIEQGCQIKKEYYLGVVVDRNSSLPTFIISSEGGMDIEEVAEKNPQSIHKVSVNPFTGIKNYQLLDIFKKLNLNKEQSKSLKKVLSGVLKCFWDTDASLVEINPLVLTESDEFVVLDAKMNFDSNALYRQKDILSLRDLTQEDPLEVEASEHDIAFVKLDGNIGCMVNGAGLAMATMDIIKFHGSSPANFLDVGGGASQEKVCEAFKIILRDPRVKGILVNIFGGIMKCDVIANGIVEASKKLNIQVPLVVRLEGTRVEEGKEVLKTSGLKIESASSLSEAAKKIVEMTKGN